MKIPGFAPLFVLASLQTLTLAAQTSASATANVTTSIYTPITVTKTIDLSFGDVFPGTVAGTVTVDPAGAATTFTGTGVSLGVHPAVAASYTMTGKKNASFSLALPANNSVSLAGPGVAMTLTNFTAAVGVGATTAGPSLTAALGAAGTQTFKVGATMNVGNAQMEGSYTGSYNVTVTYN